MSYKLLLLSIVVMCHATLMAQIGGLSSTKLSSFSSSTIEKNNLEFEPGFNHSNSRYCFDEDGNLKSHYSTTDSIRKVTIMAFRFTYGLAKNLEVGLSISSDLTISNWAAKYQLFQGERMGLATILGVNIPMGNQVDDNKIHTTDNIKIMGIGGVCAYQFTERFSADFNLQYNKYLVSTDDKDLGGTYANLDLGYYMFKSNLQLMSGVSYRHIHNEIGKSHQLLTLDFGFSLESAKNFSLAINFPFDIYGKRESKSQGFGFVLTINLN